MSEQSCETGPAAEIMSLEGHTAERITFGVDSGAALTVIGKDVATEYPGVQGLARRMTDCQGSFCKSDRGVSSQEPAVGELLVEDQA